MKEKRYLLLFSGLTLMCIAFILKYVLNVEPLIFEISLGAAILLKILFLIFTFRQNGFHLKLSVIFILTGILLIITATNCKNLVPLIAYQSMFFGAIGLKVTGLILLILKK